MQPTLFNFNNDLNECKILKVYAYHFMHVSIFDSIAKALIIINCQVKWLN